MSESVCVRLFVCMCVCVYDIVYICVCEDLFQINILFGKKTSAIVTLKSSCYTFSLPRLSVELRYSWIMKRPHPSKCLG